MTKEQIIERIKYVITVTTGGKFQKQEETRRYIVLEFENCSLKDVITKFSDSQILYSFMRGARNGLTAFHLPLKLMYDFELFGLEPKMPKEKRGTEDDTRDKLKNEDDEKTFNNKDKKFQVAKFKRYLKSVATMEGCTHGILYEHVENFLKKEDLTGDEPKADLLLYIKKLECK